MTEQTPDAAGFAPFLESKEEQALFDVEKTFSLAGEVLTYIWEMEDSWRRSNILAFERSVNQAREALHDIRLLNRRTLRIDPGDPEWSESEA